MPSTHNIFRANAHSWPCRHHHLGAEVGKISNIGSNSKCRRRSLSSYIMPATAPCAATANCLPGCMLTACSGIKLCNACLQAKRAGAQAGWGFAKPHPSWPKPDRSAATALGPLRRVSNFSLHSQVRLSFEEPCEGPVVFGTGASAMQAQHLLV